MPRIPSSTLSRLSREFFPVGGLVTAGMIAPAAFSPYALKSSVSALAASLSPAALSGSYADLADKPAIPSSPGDLGAATAAQGALAEAAHAWGNHALAGYLTGDVLRPLATPVDTTDEVTFDTVDGKRITIQVSADGQVLKFLSEAIP